MTDNKDNTRKKAIKECILLCRSQRLDHSVVLYGDEYRRGQFRGVNDCCKVLEGLLLDLPGPNDGDDVEIKI